MYAAALAGVDAQGAPDPAPVIVIQKPTAAQLVRAAFKENRNIIKTNLNNRAI